MICRPVARRFRRLRTAAVAGLVVLTIVAVVAAVVAVIQRQEALRQRNQAIAQRLNSDTQSMLAFASAGGGDTRAFQQLLAARTLVDTPDNGALLHALAMRFNTVKMTDYWLAGMNKVAFSPDGRRIATAEEDRTVRLWHVSTTRARSAHPARGHTDNVFAVAFSPDGHTLASTSVQASRSCPTVATTPEAVKAAFIKKGDTVRGRACLVLDTFVNLSKPDLFERQMYEQFKDILGLSPKRIAAR